MARHEDDREDLLREATALVERAEFKCGGQSIVAGFRRDGSASFFLSPEEVYQFNSAGELRRAFLIDNLYKAEAGNLVRLTRQRTATSVDLLRHELTIDELAGLLIAAQNNLRDLRQALAQGNFALIGQVPASGDVISRLLQWLDALPASLVVAAGPRAR